MRRTSIETYNEIRENGLLGQMQWRVYDVLFNHGPLTQNELHREHFPETQPRNVQPRVSELEGFGVVYAVRERPCRITGRTCLEWDVTEDLPDRVTPRETAQDVIKRQAARILELEREVEQIRKLIPRQPSLFGH